MESRPSRRAMAGLAVGLASALWACGGGGGMVSRPGPAAPPLPFPTRVGNIVLEVVSASPMAGASLARGRRQRFVTTLRYDAADSAASPLFLVGQLTQYAGGTVADKPDDFHFETPARSGTVEAVIERDVIDGAGEVRITWILAMLNPDRTTFGGATITVGYGVP